jgi:hypothetical protein
MWATKSADSTSSASRKHQANASRSSSESEAEFRLDGRLCKVCQIRSAIASHSRNTSLFQKRRTVKPSTEAFNAEPIVPTSVISPASWLIVLTAVKLHDDAAVETEEVDDIAADWHLPPKLESGKPPNSKFAPDEFLGWRLTLPKIFRAPAVSGHDAPSWPLMCMSEKRNWTNLLAARI